MGLAPFTPNRPMERYAPLTLTDYGYQNHVIGRGQGGDFLHRKKYYLEALQSHDINP